jgi:hypothetical protein
MIIHTAQQLKIKSNIWIIPRKRWEENWKSRILIDRIKSKFAEVNSNLVVINSLDRIGNTSYFSNERMGGESLELMMEVMVVKWVWHSPVWICEAFLYQMCYVLSWEVRSDLHPNNPNKYKYHQICSLLLTIIGTELVGHKARCAQLAGPAR